MTVLSLGVLAVGDCITDDILQEDLQYTACLFVDETRDPLDREAYHPHPLMILLLTTAPP